MCGGQPGRRVDTWPCGSVVDVSMVGHTAKLESLYGSIHLFGHNGPLRKLKIAENWCLCTKSIKFREDFFG